jgi:hypothetical protein
MGGLVGRVRWLQAIPFRVGLWQDRPGQKIEDEDEDEDEEESK